MTESASSASWMRGYAADTAHAITLAVTDEGAVGRVNNVGEPEALSTEEWVRAIAQAAGWEGEVVQLPGIELSKSSDASLDTDQDLVVGTTRIRDELGYAEQLPRDEALRRTVVWERANKPYFNQ